MNKLERKTQEKAAPVILTILDFLEAQYHDSPRHYYMVRILKSLFAHPGMTRKDLIEGLSIRPGTVIQIVSKLITDGMVYESLPEPSISRGRPEIPLYINREKWLSIVVSFVSREMHVELVDSFDVVLCKETLLIPSNSDNTDMEQYIGQLVMKIIAENPCRHTSIILGISFSIPGIVDSLKKSWIFSARWPKIRNLNLIGIQEMTGIEISVRRQLDIQLNHVMLLNPALKVGNTLLFHWGYGIGGAFAFNGEIASSVSGVFCQIGHIAINPNSNKPCTCGQVGCLETEAAYWALQSEITRICGDIADDNEMQAAESLLEHPIRNEPFFRKALTSIAYALSYLQALLVPNHTILYGMFVEDPEVRALIETKIRQLSPPFVADKLSIGYINVNRSWEASTASFYDFKKAIQSYIAGQ